MANESLFIGLAIPASILRRLGSDKQMRRDAGFDMLTRLPPESRYRQPLLCQEFSP